MGLAAVYASIRVKTQERLYLHVIVDNSFSEGTRLKLVATVKPGDRIQFYESDLIRELESLSRALDGRYSKAIVWRAWIADYLKYLKKCVLLDCDLIFNFDLKYLYQVGLSHHAISASLRVTPRAVELHEWLGVPPENYFRLTCVVLNLELMRAEKSFCSDRSLFLTRLNDAANKGLKGAWALEQSLFNHFYFDKNIPFDMPLIPVDRMKGHSSELEWQQALLSGGPRILDMKGWTSQTRYSEEYWEALSLTSWRDELDQLRFQSGG